jgi:hypothetical protein
MNIFENFFNPRRTDTDTIKNIYWSSCKVPAIVATSECNFNIPGGLSKDISISNYMDTHPEAADLLPITDGQAERRTENMVNLKVA